MHRLVGRAPLCGDLLRFLDGEGRKAAAIHGIGGVGKTALAHGLRTELEERGTHVHWIPCAQVGPSPPALVDALRYLGIDGLATLGHEDSPDLLVLDGAEHLRGALEWLVVNELAKSGPRFLLLHTGRQRPTLRLESHLRMFCDYRAFDVGPLNEQDAAALLDRLGVPPSDHAACFAITQGHPLAIVLMAEWRHATGEPVSSVQALPADVVAQLARTFLENVPDGPQRRALMAACTALHVDEPLLRRLNAPAYDWLANLPFVERTSFGLAPHDLVREAIHADLVSRDAEQGRELGREVVRHLLARIAPVRDFDERRRLVLEGLYAVREEPAVREHLRLDYVRSTFVDEPADPEIQEIREHIEAFEGAIPASVFETLARDGSLDVHVVRDSSGTMVGLLAYVRLAGITDAIAEVDPPLGRARSLASTLTNDGVPPPVCRWFFSLESHQDFSASFAAVMFAGPTALSRLDPIPRFMVTITQEVDRWLPFAPLMFLELAPEGRMVAHGAPVGMWVVDLHRAVPGEDMATVLLHAQAKMLAGYAGVSMEGVEDEIRMAVPVTAALVRRGLADLHNPRRLDAHPLVARIAEGSRGEELARAIHGGIEELEGSATEQELGALLRATYGAPDTKQVVAALSLGLPWGTYRHRLRKAIDALREVLERHLA